MTLEPIGLLTLAVAALALWLGADFAVYVFVPATLLEAAGAILLHVGGTIQPGYLLLGVAALTTFMRRRAATIMARSLTFPREGFWLVATAVYAAVGALFLPRLLAGVTRVNAVGVTDYGFSFQLLPLGPTSGNVTQSIYLLADVLCFLVVLGFVGTRDGVRKIVTALLAFSLVNIAFAFIDLITFWTHTAYLLDFIRNAQYAFHLDEASDGLKRIAGSFTETSAFAYATIGSFGFTARLWIEGFRPRLTLALSAVSLVLLILSTSSTALVAAPILLLWLYVTCVAAARKGQATQQAIAVVAFAPILAVAALAALAFDHSAVASMRDYLDVTIFDKASSQSGMARGEWNEQALRNFVDTWGIGGGLGSIRASSFILAVLSNLGWPGAILLTPFFLLLFIAPRPTVSPGTAAVQAAARTACFGLLVAACVSGSLVDLSLPFFIFAAVACARPLGQSEAVARPVPAKYGGYGLESAYGARRSALEHP